jgi:hypothetical protein
MALLKQQGQRAKKGQANKHKEHGAKSRFAERMNGTDDASASNKRAEERQ